jgi:hypothetical protein
MSQNDEEPKGRHERLTEIADEYNEVFMSRGPRDSPQVSSRSAATPR